MVASSKTVISEPPRQILYETLFVIVLTLVLALLTPLKGIAVLLPVVYLFGEARLRHRSWADLGIKPREFLQAIGANWQWILLVGVVLQIVVPMGAQLFYPAFLEHVRERVPLFDNLQLLGIVGALLVSTLIEELSFRALFQERLSWFVGTPTAILFAALVFGLMHISTGTSLVIALDVGFVILDGALYGIIFARGKNLFAAWVAHFLADVIGILFLLWWA